MAHATTRAFADERRSAIMEMLEHNASVQVAEIAQTFGVSSVTARAHLDALAESGKLRRTHGGAVSLQKRLTVSTQDRRINVNVAAKQAIAQSAIELVGGWALKKFFHTTWWDYSDQPFNLGGYICLKFSILWGLCVVVVIRIVHTAIASLVHWIPFMLGAILVGIFIALFITDTIVTVLTIRKLNEKLTVINDMSARLRKESDAISNGLGRLTLLADEKITEQKQEFNEKARPVLEEKLQAQRAQLSEKYEEYRASLEDRRVKAQKSAEDLRAQWNSVTSKLQRHTQRRLLRAFPTMKNDRADEALRRLRAWMDEKKEN